MILLEIQINENECMTFLEKPKIKKFFQIQFMKLLGFMCSITCGVSWSWCKEGAEIKKISEIRKKIIGMLKSETLDLVLITNFLTPQ